MEDFISPLNQDCEGVFAAQFDFLKRRDSSAWCMSTLFGSRKPVSISLKNPASVTLPFTHKLGRCG